MKKILMISICLILILLALASCNNAPKLNSPLNVHFVGPRLTWNAVENADSYIVTIRVNNSKYSITTSDTFYDVTITSAGDYTATVVAKRQDKSFSNSNPSESAVYHMGAGTEEDPILIYSVEELKNIGPGGASFDDGGGIKHFPKYFLLMNDINLGGQEWEPIGKGSNEFFQGHFDGQGYTISNFKITSALGANKGLFMGIENGSVRNLNVSGYTINVLSTNNTGFWIGGLAGQAKNATVENCRVEGGSITFLAQGWSTGADSRTQYIGQLIGDTNNSTIKSSSASGSMNVKGHNLHIGGLIGRNQNTLVDKCSSAGSIIIEGNTLYAGGLIGNHINSTSKIINCYSRTAVTAQARSQINLGSLVGQAQSSAQIISSYSTGILNGNNSGTSGTRIAFIGNCSTNNLSNLFYDYETMGIGENKDAGNNPFNRSTIFSTSTANMKLQATFTGFDFTEVWAIDADINNGYPYLR